MDTIQSAILVYRLNNLSSYINSRRNNAKIYFENLKENYIHLPYEKPEEFNTYHTFVIMTKKRDELKKYLLKKKIETAIHYPIPIHLQPAASFLKYKKGDFPVTENQAKQILTLPIHQYLNKSQILYVCKIIKNFLEK